MARFLNFASYNMRGFAHGSVRLLELCKGHDAIVIQEHCLTDCDLQSITSLYDDFVVMGRVNLISVSSNCKCLAVMISLQLD